MKSPGKRLVKTLSRGLVSHHHYSVECSLCVQLENHMPDLQSLAKQRHPVALFYLAITMAFFNFSLGSINSILVIYLTKHLHLTEAKAYGIYAVFNAFIFTLPIVGGFLGSRCGYKRSAKVGIFFCVAAMLLMSITSQAMLTYALGLYAIAYALALPALFTLPGLLYQRHDPRRESGLTLFYIIMNCGFLAAPFSTGYLSRWIGYDAAFLAAGLSLVIALLVFSSTADKIKTARAKAADAILDKPNSTLNGLLVLMIVIGFPIVVFLLHYKMLANALVWLSFVAAIGIVIWLVVLQRSKIAKYRLYALLTLLVVNLAFWLIYMLEPSLVTLFISNNVDRVLLGHRIPAATFYSLDPIFVIFFGFFLSRLWRHLASKGQQPSTPAKFSTAVIIMGLGSLALFAGVSVAASGQLVNMTWVVLAYIAFSLAELLIAPTALAMVGRLAPQGHEGTMMGVFNLFVGFAAILSGYIGQLTSIPKHANLTQSAPIYAHSFMWLAIITIVLGLLSTVLIKPVSRLMVTRRG